MVKVLVSGACGKMGREVVNAVNAAEDMTLVGAVDIVNIGEDIGSIALGKENGIKIQGDLKLAIDEVKPDVVVDFTQPNSAFQNAKTILEAGARPVIGTTGLKEEEIEELKKLSEKMNLSGMIAPNFTTGAVLMMMFAQMAAKYFDNAEIIEYHHNQKKDAPSGTAVKTAQLMAKVNPDLMKGNCQETETIQGSRGGTANGNIHIHSVRMPGYMASQEVLFGSMGQILSIRHDSVDRKCYMPGVLMGIRYVTDNKKFIYGLDNIL
ncbi:MAG: 4-hydroxy-tetrahydrodipicolinate reductase [bacterium]|nr:4-hydroxy-tetrahydrodipicolinate reductase [bacterium]